MVQSVEAGVEKSGFSVGRIGKPPLPQEHGAWGMVYTSTLVLLLGIGAPIVPSVLFFLAVSSAFFSQNIVGRYIGGRWVKGMGFWLGVYVSTLALTGFLLVIPLGKLGVVWIGLAGVAVFLRQSLKARSLGKKLDRSTGGELLAIAGLTLGAPGAYLMIDGNLHWVAGAAWLGMVLYYFSSVLYVKMLVSGATFRGDLDAGQRWRLGSGLAIYHAGLVLVLSLFLLLQPERWAWLIAAGYLPILIRAYVGWAKLSDKMPPFKHIGYREVAYGLWFAVFSVAGLRMWGFH